MSTYYNNYKVKTVIDIINYLINVNKHEEL
jgi:hypothetical protein